MTENVTGYDWVLERGTATGASLPAPGSDTFTLVEDTEEVKPPFATREVTERFVTDKTASKKFLGSTSWNAATLKLLWAKNDAVHQTLEADSYAAFPNNRRNWRIRRRDGSRTYNWVGFISKFEFDAFTNQEVNAFALEIAVDGDVTVS